MKTYIYTQLKKITAWSLLVVGLTTATSCKDALVKSPLTEFARESFWQSESNAMLALAGVYRGNNIYNVAEFNPADWWSYHGLIFLEFASDNAYDRRGDNSAVHKLTNGTNLATNAYMTNYWTNSYLRIARCHEFLENIDRVPMDETRKKRMIAEVKFIRASQYFYMSQYWGGVPLVTKSLTPSEANAQVRATKAEIVKFTEDEFKASVADLPRHKDVVAAERGRVTKQTVLAFLGRLYLAEKRYQEAADAYKQIIDFGDNSIDPNYLNLFIPAGENSNEIIFANQFVNDLQGQGFLQHCYPAVANGWHIFCPLGSIAEEYEFSDGTPFSYTDSRYDSKNLGKSRDPRFDFNLIYNNASFKGRTYTTHPDVRDSPDQLGAGKQTTQTGYGIRKFNDESYSGNLQQSGGNIPVIRYAEVLLGYLEAKIETGEVTQALLDQTINLIRKRASVQMPPITFTTLTRIKEQMRHERRVELAFEGIRYWDLLRWGIAHQVLNGDFYGAPFPGANNIRKKGTTIDPNSRWYVTTRAFRQGVDYLWPIPQSEININPNLKQNPGY